MADDTPDAPAAETKPTPRRRGPNKPKSDGIGHHRPEGAAKPGRKPRAVKSLTEAVAESAGKAEHAVAEAAKVPTASVTAAAKSAAKAIKPRAGKRGTPRPAAKGKTAATAKQGWGKTALAGGLAAAGALATAAVLALRGSTRKPSAPKPSSPKPPVPATKPDEKKAHQPDGTDSSKSFSAGIADESTIPDAE